MVIRLPLFSKILLFSLLIIPSSCFAMYSDSEIMSKYNSPEALQSALDNGTINYDDLPSDIQKLVHHTIIQVPSPSPQIPDFITSMPLILLVLVVAIIPIIIIFHYISGHPDKDESDSEEKTTTKTEDKVTKVSMDSPKTKEDHPMGDKTHD